VARHHPALHDAFGLQLFQPLGEHAVAHHLEPLEELPEPRGPPEEHVQHETRPTLADEIHGNLETGTELLAMATHEGVSIKRSISISFPKGSHLTERSTNLTLSSPRKEK